MIKTKIMLVALMLIGTFSSCKSTFPDAQWVNKQWTAVEMLGVPVQTSNSPEDAHLFFNPSGKIVNGNGSCNPIYGPYEIGKKSSLKFGNLASTRMACQNQAFENKYLEVLQSVEFYQLSGGELWLKDSRKQVVLKLR
jgi:heat shock protein HslJ